MQQNNRGPKSSELVLQNRAKICYMRYNRSYGPLEAQQGHSFLNEVLECRLRLKQPSTNHLFFEANSIELVTSTSHSTSCCARVFARDSEAIG